ncbi:MAG: response regulator transcription factor [Bacteroidota bacterium]
MNKPRFLTLCLLLSLASGLKANREISGIVAGTLKTDSTWSPVVYLSVITGFDDMYKMSDKMIVAESPLDSLGSFYFDTGFLPSEETLLRIHMVRRGNPRTTLMIGGKEQNHFFFIANKNSVISIRNLSTGGIFSGVSITGSPATAVFNRINELAGYPELIDYEKTILEKEFVEEVVNERLRSLADSSSNLLIALYAIYKSDYVAHYDENKAYYKAFLKKWEMSSSPYFSAFKKQLPVKIRKWEYIFLASIVLVSVPVAEVLIRRNKKRKLNSLSVQERKIYQLLQQGATNQEICDECHIELSTVKSHVSSIFNKLNIKSRKEVLHMK